MFGTASLDENTVVSASEGDASQLDAVLRTLEPQIRLMVSGRLAAKAVHFHAVEEITQLVLVALSTAIRRLDNRTPGGLRAFVSGIVNRKVADHLKRRGGGDLIGPSAASLDSTVAALSQNVPLWQCLAADGTSPGTAVVRADEAVRLIEELSRLKPEHRKVVTLAFFDQMPTGEIAVEMGISRPAASMLLIRAVKALRRNMTGSSRIEDTPNTNE